MMFGPKRLWNLNSAQKRCPRRLIIPFVSRTTLLVKLIPPGFQFRNRIAPESVHPTVVLGNVVKAESPDLDVALLPHLPGESAGDDQQSKIGCDPSPPTTYHIPPSRN